MTTSQVTIPTKVSSGVKSNKLTLKKIRNLGELERNQELNILIPPHMSMQFLQNGQGTPTDWFKVTFRIFIGFHTCEKFYSRKDIDKFNDLINIMLRMYADCRPTDQWKFKNQDDLDQISNALVEVDWLQSVETRETMIYCFRKARTSMDGFMKKQLQ